MSKQAMQTQKHLFGLAPDIHYFNTAAYGPALNTAVTAGMEGLMKKSVRPYDIQASDHFEQANTARSLFSELINAGDADRIAVIPAVSFGLGVVARNLHRLPGIEQKKQILIIEEEFPNDVYAFERVVTELGLSIQMVAQPEGMEERGARWNQALLDAITETTALVVIPQVHWIYGVVFDLEAVGKKCKELGVLFVVDASQSAGAMPIDVQKAQMDALICPAYKWLLGPYGIGLAYFGNFFDEGIPLDENWSNRIESDRFALLTRNLKEYRPKAQRYNVGEFGQFAQMPVLVESLRQILSWSTAAIQAYAADLMKDAMVDLLAKGYQVEAAAYRAQHLFGLNLPAGMDAAAKMAELRAHKIYASQRGSAIRLSVHLLNDTQDVEKLCKIL